jgi:GT2 family glycosyltransferase
MIKKDVLDDVGVFDENLEVCEDYDLWLRIAIRYKIGLINEKLIIKYAGHNDQLSFKYWGMDRFRVKALKKLLDTPKKEQIRQELIKKYTLLIKGAKKYDKIQDILFYEEKLKNL